MPFPYCSESKTFDDDWLKAESTVHLLTLFGWTVPSGVAIKAYGDTSLLGRASIDYFFVVCHLNIFFYFVQCSELTTITSIVIRSLSERLSPTLLETIWPTSLRVQPSMTSSGFTLLLGILVSSPLCYLAR